MSRSIGRRNGPSPIRTSSNASPSPARRPAASIRSIGPFASTSRPTNTRRGASGIGTHAWSRKTRVEPATDDADFRPVGMLAPAVELAPPEFTDRDGELRTSDLLAQGELHRPVELVRPVDRQAVGDSGEDRCEHGHGGGVHAKVVV